MFKRKLSSLDFHNCDNFDVNDDLQLRNMVIWLEDQKIRHYKIEDRTDLRNATDVKWVETFTQYLNDLNCPIVGKEKTAVVDWLLGYAVRLEYGDNVDAYKNVQELNSSKNKNSTVANPLDNPLDALDFDDPDFKAGVASLAQLLQIPPHPDHKKVLQGICILVKNKLSKQALSSLNKNEKEMSQIPLEKMNLGFETGDYISAEAAKILRLLYIQELRELQNEINTAIVQVQAITANPKTDTKLGKVGR